MMIDDQLLRFSRQIMLPQIDISGQEALLESSVLIIGLGGLGCPAAMYLAAAGVGHIILNDFDDVELSNLQRQIAHSEADIGRSKVSSVKTSIEQLNSDIRVSVINRRLDDLSLEKQVNLVKVVLDCSDNYLTRHQVNKLCVKAGVPLVSGAAIGFDGQLAVFDSRRNESPCYCCLYPEMDEEGLSCAENGVLAPLAGVVGSMQAIETIKLIAKFGEPLVGRLLVFDGLVSEWRRLNVRRDPNCSVCGED